MGRQQAERTLIDSLDRVRIRDSARRMKQHPHELSGGMLQRAVIASSIVTDPRLLIADEPTTALDVTVQADVLRQFRAINRAQGTATLFISHDFGVVKALCDKVLVMRGGEIIERLTGDQLVRGDVQHPYTRQLLAATPTLDTAPVPPAAPAAAAPVAMTEGETVDR
jgi:ABC-type dipeptide/oligopeptide/nickel transport system ATPase component